ncbi:hypothetical protein BB559_006165 [Furculomyces boomerangus]|uniref:C2H2-type domain-containing protein n=1 Tax=Furculomyces boomerangus TaxID=61424 RepID=A0A2T9Y4I3_9FUNG|nr:hypothetical protein BB559_006165 [Furculomyces boomerangus]
MLFNDQNNNLQNGTNMETIDYYQNKVFANNPDTRVGNQQEEQIPNYMNTQQHYDTEKLSDELVLDSYIESALSNTSSFNLQDTINMASNGSNENSIPDSQFFNLNVGADVYTLSNNNSNEMNMGGFTDTFDNFPIKSQLKGQESTVYNNTFNYPVGDMNPGMDMFSIPDNLSNGYNLNQNSGGLIDSGNFGYEIENIFSMQNGLGDIGFLMDKSSGLEQKLLNKENEQNNQNIFCVDTLDQSMLVNDWKTNVQHGETSSPKSSKGFSNGKIKIKYVASGYTEEEIRKRKYECKYCKKRFSRPSSLKTHIYIHTGEKPYACEYPGCRKSFSVLSNLKRHAKVHMNPRKLLKLAEKNQMLFEKNNSRKNDLYHNFQTLQNSNNQPLYNPKNFSKNFQNNTTSRYPQYNNNVSGNNYAHQKSSSIDHINNQTLSFLKFNNLDTLFPNINSNSPTDILQLGLNTKAEPSDTQNIGSQVDGNLQQQLGIAISQRNTHPPTHSTHTPIHQSKTLNSQHFKIPFN